MTILRLHCINYVGSNMSMENNVSTSKPQCNVANGNSALEPISFCYYFCKSPKLFRRIKTIIFTLLVYACVFRAVFWKYLRWFKYIYGNQTAMQCGKSQFILRTNCFCKIQSYSNVSKLLHFL